MPIGVPASTLAGFSNGATPANMPVELASKIDFVINLATAKALGLSIPPNLLTLADELIE